MGKRKLIQVAIVIGGLVLCFLAFQLGSNLLFNSSERSPAAIPKIYDYSHLAGEALLEAAQDRLINGVKVISAGGASGIQLGHFVVKNDQGLSVSACELFSRVELVFFAGGMAVSGDSPKMIVIGPCTPGENINVIAPIMIPSAKILDAPVRDQEFSDFSDNAVTVKLENVSDTWPRVWILQSARLVGAHSEEIKVEDKDIRRVLGKAPYIDWQ
ncbi:MAG: hypothetical protein KDD38_10350 [Bdellovibrionales bacterium]|nr:hypothetical protein [Bdellovibrionales bacterium]